jgi:hypothetical protein
LYHTTRADNTSLSDEYRRACKKYSLGLATYETTIDIPPEMDKKGMFQPTLGPKVFPKTASPKIYFKHLIASCGPSSSLTQKIGLYTFI